MERLGQRAAQRHLGHVPGDVPGLPDRGRAGLGDRGALHWSKVVRRALYPLLIASQAIPIVVLAPILAIIIGYNITSKLVIVALVCFFPIAINTLDGLPRAWTRSTCG